MFSCQREGEPTEWLVLGPRLHILLAYFVHIEIYYSRYVNSVYNAVQKMRGCCYAYPLLAAVLLSEEESRCLFFRIVKNIPKAEQPGAVLDRFWPVVVRSVFGSGSG